MTAIEVLKDEEVKRVRAYLGDVEFAKLFDPEDAEERPDFADWAAAAKFYRIADLEDES